MIASILEFIRKLFPRLDGYKSWVSITVTPMNFNMVIVDPILTHGKFYKCGATKNVSPAPIPGTVVKVGHSFNICSCGRFLALFGSQGRFSMADMNHRGSRIDSTFGTCLWASNYRGRNMFELIHENGLRYTFKIVKHPTLAPGTLGYASVQIIKQT